MITPELIPNTAGKSVAGSSGCRSFVKCLPAASSPVALAGLAIYFVLISPVFSETSSPPGHAEVNAADPAAVPDAAKIRERIGRMQEVKLDLDFLTAVSEHQERKVRAKQILSGIIESGDPVLANHATSFLSYVPDPGLERALRARLGKLGPGWSEEQLGMSIRHYLALLGDGESLGVLIGYTASTELSFRIRAYRTLRDIQPESVDPAVMLKVRTSLNQASRLEKDPAAQSASLSALAGWAEVAEAKGHVKRLEALAADPTDRGRVRAAFEMRQLRRWKRETDSTGSGGKARRAGLVPPETPQELPQAQLMQLLRKGGHDEQMFVLEALAQERQPATDQMMAALGGAADWHPRLQSAFYLMLTRDTLEADSRLREEKHPFVQLVEQSRCAAIA